MKVKHFAGYGSVNIVKVKDKSCTLHIKVIGNHEYGLVRDDMYDLFNWLIKKFDKSFPDYTAFRRACSGYEIKPGCENGTDICDYLFFYNKEVAV